MKLPLISIIIPVYKVEKYINKCLESVVNQSYNNIEIILIDDGSPDQCGEICDNYAKCDKRIRVVHKTNGGLSDARNTGLEICTGDYIGFVDGDDYISHDMYEKMLEYALQNDVDVVMCGAANVIYNKEQKNRYFEPYVLRDKTEIINNVLAFPYDGASTTVCNKLFKKEIFKNLKFDKNVAYEDDYIVLKWINKTNSLGIMPDPFYKYVQRRDSITHKRHYTKTIQDVINAYENNRIFVYRFYKQSVEAVDYRYWWAYRCSLDLLLECCDYKEHLSDAKYIQRKIRNNIVSIISNKYNSLKQIVAYIAISIDINLYKIVKQINSKTKISTYFNIW